MAETAIRLQFRHLNYFSDSDLHRFPWRKGFQLRFLEWAPEKRLMISPILKAASSPSPALDGSSFPQYSEQLLGARPEKKKQSVAGIDQDELLDPSHLADPDSCFCEFMGVQVHYKVSEVESEPLSSSHKQTSSQLLDQTKKIGVPMILLHGFGASVFSWHRVMKPLSRCIGSKVLAFDRPAFGLTSRVGYFGDSRARDDENSLNPYSTKFSVLNTIHFMDMLESEKAILVGHSAGSLTAVGAYFEAPDRVAALILVAPAIVAPLSDNKVNNKSHVKQEMKIKEDPDTRLKVNFFTRLRQILSKAYEFIALSIMRLVKGIMDMAKAIYKKALSAVLRSAVAVTLVRMIIDKFGITAIKSAWYDATQISDHILHGYTKPLRTKGWDKALVEYAAAMLTGSAADSTPDPTKRLNEIACPVLIITGDSDRLVPPWNSKRLASAIPGSQLEIIKNCGHLPHEERPEEFISLVNKFLQRVFAGSEDWCLQEEYDTHDPKGQCFTVLPFLRKRTKIIEIVAAHDIVFALAMSGLCAAFSRDTNEKVCFLNISEDEVIRSLFYNKNNDSLITVSVYASDSFSSLKCRSTRIEYIKRGKPDAGFALFESESLKWPGFVEFDDVNGKVLTYSAQDSVYKVFDLKNYRMLYSISDQNVQEIKISPGIMLLIFNKGVSHVPLKILSIEDGTVLKSFNHLIHRNKKVDFIEQFNEKLLVKQENENLQILDVRNSDLREVSRTEFMTPSAFIFLYENQLFLTFRNRTVAVWNFRGELVTSFEDHLLWHSDCNTNNIYITSDQDLIISYCKADADDPKAEGTGSINVSNILSGKCLAKIKVEKKSDDGEDISSSGSSNGSSGSSSSRRRNSRKRAHASRMGRSVEEALEDITALFYDEERNEIYTGNSHGLLHVWSN